MVLLVARRVYAEAERAYRRGDRRLAWQLARALRRLPGPYAARAAALEQKVQVWLRSQRKGRSAATRAKKTSARVVTARAARQARAAIAAGLERGSRDGEETSELEPFDVEEGTDDDFEGEEGSARVGLGDRGEDGGAAAVRRRRSRSGVRRQGRKAGEDRTGSVIERQRVVRRTPHMNLSAPEPIPVGAAFDVDVWADERRAREDERSEPLAVRMPKGVRELALSVRLLLSPHFRAEGTTRKDLIVRRDRRETDHLKFAVSVRDGNLPSSRPEITAIFSYHGRPAGKVVRQPAIAGFRPKPPASRKLAFAPEMVVSPDAEPPDPIAEIQTNARGADLTISIVDAGEKDGRHYHMIVHAAGGEHWEGEWVLPKRSDELVKSAMDAFVQSDETGTGTTGRIAALTGAGIDMFQATPEGFQTLFWTLVDKKTLRTILIVSEEPYIPWELMVPIRWRDGRREDREPLGVEFAIGRWLHRQYISPPQKMSFTLTYVVAPRYSVERRLSHAEREAKLVATSFPPSRRIDPASVTTLDKAVGDKDVTLLHFVCHGKAEAPQTIYMDNEKDNLNCLQVKALKGFLHTFPRARTFVFLNACEVGRPAPALVGIGGLANEFLAIGAGGVVAPLWSVADDVAFQVAKEFYEAIGRSPKTPFATIVQALRRKAYEGTAEDTWAAYCFYGDPRAALQVREARRARRR
jgi:hypothetical protein